MDLIVHASEFAVIPATGACPESLGEQACFVGRQVPKNAPTRPIVRWPSTPVQRTLTTPPPAPSISGHPYSRTNPLFQALSSGRHSCCFHAMAANDQR
jgi:hypothetical protein